MSLTTLNLSSRKEASLKAQLAAFAIGLLECWQSNARPGPGNRRGANMVHGFSPDGMLCDWGYRARFWPTHTQRYEPGAHPVKTGYSRSNKSAQETAHLLKG